MTEQEKWHGKDFKPKEGNTGKKKQDTWTENIHAAVAESQSYSPKIAAALQRLLSYDNVPRKESKFKVYYFSFRIPNPEHVRNETIMCTGITLSCRIFWLTA